MSISLVMLVVLVFGVHLLCIHQTFLDYSRLIIDVIQLQKEIKTLKYVDAASPQENILRDLRKLKLNLNCIVVK